VLFVEVAIFKWREEEREKREKREEDKMKKS